MNQHQSQIDSLFAAELQFRLASAVRPASSAGKQTFDLPIEWSHGDHRVGYQEVALRSDQSDFAAWCMHRSATYMLAMAAKDAIRCAVAELRRTIARLGELRARSHHRRTFTAEDRRELATLWHVMEAGLEGLIDDVVIDS